MIVIIYTFHCDTMGSIILSITGNGRYSFQCCSRFSTIWKITTSGLGVISYGLALGAAKPLELSCRKYKKMMNWSYNNY